MKVSACVLAIALALAAGNRDAAQAPPVGLRMVAVQATREGASPPSYGAGLDEVRGALREVTRFDTFKKLAASSRTCEMGSECRFEISGRYALLATALAREDSGRVRVKARIEERQATSEGERVRDALNTTSAVVPGDHLLLGGLALDQGELVVVLSVAR